ncbi:radical SAM protein [Acetobacteraceae bacterium]|nr:radical SAM protein [Acetobacteraceae bacterium]
MSVTNYCNADCDFCGFRKSLNQGEKRDFLDAQLFIGALPILKRSGVSFINFQGGEPLLHPEILEMIRAVSQMGMKADLITNGWKLHEQAGALVKAGLHCLFVSLDSENLEKHEKNRRLRGVGERLKKGIAEIKEAGIPVIASVTVSKLLSPLKLPLLLKELGFSGVTFSYPRQQPFASSSKVYGGSSTLVSFSVKELDQFLVEIKKLKKAFPTLNPIAGIEDMRRHIAQKREAYPCVGGFKYYYLDWHLNLWRCEAWGKSFGKLTDFEKLPENKAHCTECMLSCYRDSSVLMFAPLSFGKVLQKLSKAHYLEAWQLIQSPSFWNSLKAGIQDGWLYWKIFKGKQKRRKC